MIIEEGTPAEYNISGVEKRIKKFNSLMPINFRVGLDLGAGRGAYTKLLNNYGTILFASDINRNYLLNLLDRNLDNLAVCCSAELNAFKNNKFDAVFIIEVLDHVLSLSKTISEIDRICKPNAVVYVSVPNKYFPLETHLINIFKWKIHGKYIPFISMIDFIHQRIGTARRFSPKDLKSLFINNGFEYIGHDFMMPPFDYSIFGKRFFKAISEIIEKSKVKFMGATLMAAFVKK